ncbi:MAG: hypothetical protein JWP25_1194 [Bradyrhizobium sp.]|nr:hypothetical protein [Bradyrhizobium sp.]
MYGELGTPSCARTFGFAKRNYGCLCITPALSDLVGRGRSAWHNSGSRIHARWSREQLLFCSVCSLRARAYGSPSLYSHLAASPVRDVICQLLRFDPFAVLPAIAGLDGLVAVREHHVLSNQLILQVGHAAASRAFRLDVVEM